MVRGAISIRYTPSVLDLAILGLLQERELHGYEIRKRLREQLGLLANVSFGSLYPALARLEASGSVESAEVPPAAGASQAPAAPPTGSLSGEWAVLRSRRTTNAKSRRARKVYRITDAGRELFVELLERAGAADDARSFGLRWALARHLGPQARLRLLERRRAQLVQQLAEMDRPPRGLDAYARAVLDHSAETITQDIEWLDRLIEAERSSRELGRTSKPAVHSALAHGAGQEGREQ